MNKNYVSPKAEVNKFVSEDVITTSGTTNNPLTAVASKTFTVSEANVSWNDRTNK